MNNDKLYLGVSTIIFCSLCIIALFLARDDVVLSRSKGLIYVLMGCLGGFMFLLGYLPLSIYRDERREMHFRQTGESS